MNEPTFICTRCHGEIPMSERCEFDARDYCPRCLDAITAICHVCGTRFPLTHNHGTEDVPLCEKCLHTRNHAGIEDYCYKPRPIFYGKGPRYFGVELEIDDGGESDSNANEIMSAANSECEYCRTASGNAGSTQLRRTALCRGAVGGLVHLHGAGRAK